MSDSWVDQLLQPKYKAISFPNFSGTVLVTGVAGSLGTTLLQKLVQASTAVCALDNDEMRLWHLEQEASSSIQISLADICDTSDLVAIFKRFRPALVVHLAALKHVPLGNRFPDRFHKVNVQGTQNVVEASLQVGTRHFIHVSTDKVTSEVSDYGKTKKQAEDMVQQHMHRFETAQILRLVNVAGTRGSVLERWQQNAIAGEPLELRGDGTERLFVHMNDVVAMFAVLMQQNISGKFVPAQYQTIKIEELAQKIAKQYGVTITRKELLPGESVREKLLFPNEHTTENLAGILHRIEKHSPIPDSNLSSTKI